MNRRRAFVWIFIGLCITLVVLMTLYLVLFSTEGNSVKITGVESKQIEVKYIWSIKMPDYADTAEIYKFIDYKEGVV